MRYFTVNLAKFIEKAMNVRKTINDLPKYCKL